MPSIVTHNLFAKEVFKELPQEIQKNISYPHYLLFAQSFDNLFYYKFLTPWKGKEIRQLGLTAQKTRTNLYFENILDYITLNHLEKNKEILSYLYGSICHYVLDYHCHPFIFYYTGVAKKAKKYHGLHEKMEINIDAYLFEKKCGKKLYQEKLADDLLPLLDFSKKLKNILDEVFRKTFHQDNMGKIYKKSVKTGNFLLKYGVTDKTGLKKILYKIKDSLTNNTRKYQYLNFHVTKILKEYLNENHDFWYNPTDKNIKSTESFEDLYNKSIKKANYIIKLINSYLTSEISKKEVLDSIGNNSYTTGMPCDKPLELKYFKF